MDGVEMKGWFNEYLKSEWTDQITPNQDGAHFFDPAEDVGHQVERFISGTQGLQQIITLRSEDVKALTDGQVLFITINDEYAIAVTIL